MRARCGTRCARMEVAPCLIIYGSWGQDLLAPSSWLGSTLLRPASPGL